MRGTLIVKGLKIIRLCKLPFASRDIDTFLSEVEIIMKHKYFIKLFSDEDEDHLVSEQSPRDVL